LTWFMKGLRHHGTALDQSRQQLDQIDLIYEGITTRGPWLHEWRPCDGGPNWPDLWRDYDVGGSFRLFPPKVPRDQIDLIYEGITTLRIVSIRTVSSTWPNWPDLWRDYDTSSTHYHFLLSWYLTKLTWFMKGLRLAISCNQLRA